MNRPWTDDEKYILRLFYPKHGAPVVAEIIGRSQNAVSIQACYMNVKKVTP